MDRQSALARLTALLEVNRKVADLQFFLRQVEEGRWIGKVEPRMITEARHMLAVLEHQRDELLDSTER